MHPFRPSLLNRIVFSNPSSFSSYRTLAISTLPILLILLALQSCTTTRPIYSSEQSLPYGQVQYDGPAIKTTLTTTGYLTIGVSTGLGGVAGFLIGRNIEITDSAGKAVDPNIVGTVGAIGGGLISGLLADVIIMSTAPKSSRLPADKTDLWLSGLQEKMQLIQTLPDSRNKDTLVALIAIPVRSADTFQVRSLKDAQFFHATFPNNPREEDILRQAVTTLPSREIPQLFKLYPASPAVQSGIERYIGDCQTVEGCLSLADDYPAYKDLATNRAYAHLQKLDDPKTLQRLAERNPQLYDAADSLAAVLARKNADPASYLNSFPRGRFKAEFETSMKSSIATVTTVRELSELAKKMPSMKDEAERRAAEIAIRDRKYMQYKAYFADGASRQSVDQALENELNGLKAVAEKHVRDEMSAIKKKGEYHAVELPPSGYLLSAIYTDWDGDGDDDLFYRFALLGDELEDGRTPITDRIGAIENHEGKGILRGESEAYELMPENMWVHDFSLTYANGSTVWANAWVDDPDDYVLSFNFNGTAFTPATVKRNNGTRELRTGGVYIIGD